MERIKLFCIPYAGGSSVVYEPWRILLSDHIELIPVELAGKGERAGEMLYNNVEEAIYDVFSFVSDRVNNTPYAIFGHSFGAMFAYEVAKKMKVLKKQSPVHVFFSGRRPPHFQSARKDLYHLMPDEIFINEVQKLGGTPPEFFNYPELLEYMIPILKNDFKLSETAPVVTEIIPFDFNITAMTGKEDREVSVNDISNWNIHTIGTCHTCFFDGGHFFINGEREKVLNIINSSLMIKN